MSAPFPPSKTSTPTTSVFSSAAAIIEQLKQKLDVTERQLGTTEQRLQYAELKIRVLEERLRLQRIAKYGPGSEKLSDAQLELLELEPGVHRAEVEAESQREALPSLPQTKRKHPGRQSLPAGLPRIERLIVCSPEQCRPTRARSSTTGTGKVLRAGDQAREASLQAVRGAWRNSGGTATAHHRKKLGQRPHRD